MNHNGTNLNPNLHKKLIHLRGSKNPYVNSSIANSNDCDPILKLIKTWRFFLRVDSSSVAREKLSRFLKFQCLYLFSGASLPLLPRHQIPSMCTNLVMNLVPLDEEKRSILIIYFDKCEAQNSWKTNTMRNHIIRILNKSEEKKIGKEWR